MKSFRIKPYSPNPASSNNFEFSPDKKDFQDRQIQLLLKENLKLAKENEKLRHEIKSKKESQEKIFNVNNGLEFKAMPLPLSSNKISDANLTYSVSESGVIKESANEFSQKRISFRLDTSMNEGNDVGEILLTEEEMFTVDSQRCSIKKPKIFYAISKRSLLEKLIIKKESNKNIEEGSILENPQELSSIDDSCTPNFGSNTSKKIKNYVELNSASPSAFDID